MSVLNKKPFINTVLEGLSEADQVKLNNLLNGQGDRTQLQRILGLASGMRTPITEADKGAHLCSLQIGPNAYDGYLLYTDDKCCLVWFTDFQTLSMFDIDVAKQKFAVVSEYLDITELRSSLNILLVEAGHAVKIQADDVDSGAATEGQALVADGHGGAIWGEAAGGGDEEIIVDFTSYTETEPTLQDLFTALDKEKGNWSIKNLTILFYRWGQNRTFVADSLECMNYTGNNYSVTFRQFYSSRNNEYYKDFGSDDPSTVNLLSIIMSPSKVYYLSPFSLPVTSNLDSSKTYNLQSVNGANPSWEEASSGGGTQLYQHLIQTDELHSLRIITNSGTSLQGEDAGSSSFTGICMNAVSVRKFDGSVVLYCYYQGIKNTIIYYDSSTGNIATEDINENDYIASDTITTL